MKTHVISDMAQAKLLTDPFKKELLEYFSEEARTTKQVADLMSLKAPRLYRHVDALVGAGLLVLIREQAKRGTVERYYQTIAQRFEVDSSLFDSGEGDSETARLLKDMFRETHGQLLSFLEGDTEIEDETLAPIVMQISGRATPTQVRVLRAKLNEWLEEIHLTNKDPDATEGTIALGGVVVLYAGHEP